MRLLLAVVSSVAVLTACGTASPGSTTASPPPTTFGGSVVLETQQVRVTEDAVVIEGLLPEDLPACGAPVVGEVIGHNRRMVWTRVSVTDATRPCGAGEVRRTVRIDVRLRGRDLVVNEEAWTPGGDDVLVKCGVFGCHPPADRCDPVYTSLVSDGVEIPTERSIDVVSCDAPWLVVDVHAVVTGCQSVDGSTPPPGCDVYRNHWFAHLDGDRWDVVASTPDAGCPDDTTPGSPPVPQRLCANLPAVG